MESAFEPTSREKILDVAENRFAQRGYAGVGLRELAEAAGLGKSSLFHHFASKAVLYAAVLDRVLERLEARVLPPAEGDGSPLERLESVSDALIDALAEHPTSARLLLRALFEDDDLPQDAEDIRRGEARIATVVGRLGSLIDEGVARGEMRPVSIGDAVQTLIGATVYHFASGEFGEGLVGGDLFSAEAVARRKREVRALLHHGIARPT